MALEGLEGPGALRTGHHLTFPLGAPWQPQVTYARRVPSAGLEAQMGQAGQAESWDLAAQEVRVEHATTSCCDDLAHVATCCLSCTRLSMHRACARTR